jgi:putative oxidoreductase
MTTSRFARSIKTAPAAVALIRLAVGWVFLSEGIQKFLYPSALGVGRFTTIGIPWPQIAAPFVASVEIAAGFLLLIGLMTRLAAVVLFLNISVAIVSSKVPILLGHGFWLFSVAKLPQYGFWSAAHEARVDLCMWLGCLFLIAVGGGTLALDARRGAKGRQAS